MVSIERQTVQLVRDFTLIILVHGLAGFKTKLIGTPDQIAERIMLLKSLGASIILVAFLNYEDDIEQFGREVLPRVRKLEAEGRGTDEAFEVERTGWIYGDNKNQNVGIPMEQRAFQEEAPPSSEWQFFKTCADPSALRLIGQWK